jgi:uncharacterized protein
MSLLIAMLPIYLLGNLHCLGMCGPLTAFLGRHRYRYLYFAGRTSSFTLAGVLAGELGAVLQLWLKHYHLSAFVSLLFGSVLVVFGMQIATGWGGNGSQWLSKRFSGVNQRLSLLLLKDQPWATFLFGFFTVFLPCGQTLVVFSACALSQSALTGLINGFAFALLTSPSLWLAMHAHRALSRWHSLGNRVLGGCALVVGILAVLRGLAEFELIPHLVMNRDYHIVLY